MVSTIMGKIIDFVSQIIEKILRRLTMNSKKKKVNMVPWRVKVYHGLPERYRLIADVAEVPVDWLVSYVLEHWTKKHKTLLMDENIPASFYVIHMVKHIRQDRQMLPSQRLLSTSREDYRHY